MNPEDLRREWSLHVFRCRLKLDECIALIMQFRRIRKWLSFWCLLSAAVNTGIKMRIRDTQGIGFMLIVVAIFVAVVCIVFTLLIRKLRQTKLALARLYLDSRKDLVEFEQRWFNRS